MSWTADQKVDLAAAHNNARCMNGVQSLSWNDTDAQSAAAAAAQCRYEHSTYTASGGRGENIYAVSYHQEAGQVITDAMATFLGQVNHDLPAVDDSCRSECHDAVRSQLCSTRVF